MDNNPYEPDAWDHLGAGNSQSESAVISIAISLKRIADRLESVTDYAFDAPAIRTRKD